MANREGVAQNVLSARTLVELVWLVWFGFIDMLNAEDWETEQRIQVLGVGMKFASIEHAMLAVQVEGVAAKGCSSCSRLLVAPAIL